MNSASDARWWLVARWGDGGHVITLPQVEGCSMAWRTLVVGATSWQGSAWAAIWDGLTGAVVVPQQSQWLPRSGRVRLKSVMKNGCVNTDVQILSHKGLHHTPFLSFFFLNARLNMMLFSVWEVHRLTGSLWEFFLEKKEEIWTFSMLLDKTSWSFGPPWLRQLNKMSFLSVRGRRVLFVCNADEKSSCRTQSIVDELTPPIQCRMRHF